jgi:hypothetical protein
MTDKAFDWSREDNPLDKIVQHMDDDKEDTFENIWEAAGSVDVRDRLFALCNRIRRKLDWEIFDYQTFDHGWQYRLPLHEEYKIARDEFMNLVFGWW